MHDQPRRTLCQLLKQYGPELHVDARRTEALLLDLCNAYPREIFVLISAQKQRVPMDLLGAPRWMPRQALTAQLIRRLQEQLALTEEAATWAVETWAMALGIQPSPPDLAWRWLQAHQPNRQALQPALDFIPILFNLGGRLFQHFGVKLAYDNAAIQALLKESASKGSSWLRHCLSRAPVRLAIVLGILAACLVGSVNRNASSSPPPLVVVEQVGVEQLVTTYPLPRTAWVSEDQLIVRAGPATGTAALGLLAAGQVVKVVAFSTTGEWSQISTPQAGWVNNAFILFQTEQTPIVYTVIKMEQAQSTVDQLNVRSGPGVSFAIVGNLGLNQTIEIVATTQDQQWKQIITPVQGWVSTAFVQVSAACGDKWQVNLARVSHPSPAFVPLVQGQYYRNEGCHLLPAIWKIAVRASVASPLFKESIYDKYRNI